MEIEKVAKIEHILNLDYSNPQGRQAIDKVLTEIKSKNIPVRQPTEAKKQRQKKLDKVKGE